MKLLLPAFLLVVAVPSTAFAFTPSTETEKLSDTLYLLRMFHKEGRHVNTLLSAGPDGLLLVDYAGDWKTMACPPEAAAVFDSAIREIGGDRPLRYIINTHWHGDHVSGNERHGDEAVIIAQTNTRNRLSQEQKPWWWPDGLRPLAAHGLPEVTFDNSLTLHFNGEDVRLYHFGPAHTDGDAVVYFANSGVAHVGDLFQGFKHPAMGEDYQGLALTYAAILSRLPRETRLVTGHGEVAGMGELQRSQAMLMAVTEHVRSQIRDGRTLEEIQASGLPKPWDTQWTGDREDVAGWYDAMYRVLAEGDMPGH